MGRINLTRKSSRGSLQVQAQPVLHSEFQDSIKSTIERKKGGVTYSGSQSQFSPPT